MKADGLEQLLLQALEHELSTIEVYQAALRCVSNDALREEWEQYLAETRSHIDVLSELCAALCVDLSRDTVGRLVVRRIGAALVDSIEHALADGDRRVAQLVACECVMLAEAKDHMNWALLCSKVRRTFGAPYSNLKLACDQMEGEEDEHLLHARGWARALWADRLRTPLRTVSEPEVDPMEDLLLLNERRAVRH